MKLQSYSRKSILNPPIFSKFQLWSQIWQWSSTNFVPKFKSYNLQLITFHSDWNPHRFFIQFHTFLDVQLKISSVTVDGFWCKIVFWKRYELQIIWFKFRHKVCWTSLSNLAPKLKFAENWKSQNRIYRITLKFQVICWDIYYFSERLWCRLSKKIQIFNKFLLWKKKKKNLVEGRCVRDVPREFEPWIFLVPSFFVK